MNQHGQLVRGILREIETNEAVSQRHLARRLGIALGLTNLLLRRIVTNGWVKVVHIRPNRVRYLLTPAGIAAKARLTREYLQRTVQFYADARERVRDRLRDLSSELDALGVPKRVVFFGAGEIAEIGYVSLQETDLQLIAVVDSQRTRPFFGLPVQQPAQLPALADDFARVIVMSFDRDDAGAELERIGIEADRTFWI